MGLNQVQKNFRKEMKQLEKDGFVFEDEIYSTTRKRKLVRKFGFGTVLLFLLLLYPLYGMFQSVQSGLTINQHSKIVTYINEMKEYNELISVSLNTTVTQWNSVLEASFHNNIVELETELLSNLPSIKPPKGFENYDTIVKDRAQEVLVLLYVLKNQCTGK